MKKILSSIRLFIKETDKLLLSMCIIASTFGLTIVMSATRCNLTEGSSFSRDFLVMLIAVFLGIALSIVISFFDYQIFTKLWPIIAGVCTILMLLLFWLGTGPSSRPDAKTWLEIGPVNFQPSELVKIGFIITFGVHLEKLKDKINKPLSIIQLGIHAIIPVVLVSATGDMGSALVFILIAAIMLFIAGLHWGYFVGGIALIGAATPLIWTYVFKKIQRERFLALIYPEAYPNQIYQQKNGINAIGAGGLTGQGLFHGSYTQAGVVPESQNDFIFTAIGEELGFIGCIAALALIAFIAVKIIYIGRKSKDFSTNLICCGMAAMIAGQMLINIGMCLMILPVIGITLPFFSAGGSSNICVYIGIGLVLSIYRHNCEQQAVNLRVYDSLKSN